jgi:lysophosphatidic acid acyltransferase/lysophosphatidylinositol acyltransferase
MPGQQNTNVINKLRSYIGYATLMSFMISGLILNVAQLFVFLLVRPFSQKLFREINHCLQYSYWSQSVAVTDWNTNVKCRIYFKDEQTYKEFGSISGIVIANHRYDIDWLAAWMLSDKLGTLGSDKAMLKSSLRYVPVIGWGWSLCDMIFLSRNWQKDRENLAKSMEILITYPRSLILSYFEGTRFTPKKYEASVAFAEEKNLPIRLRHHLVPRTRGFHCMTQVIKSKMEQDPKLKYGLYNFQVALDNDDNSKASLTSILGGTETTIHIYVGRLDVMEVPTDSEEANSKYLFELYQEKDKLFEYFKEHGRFPGLEKPYKPRWQTLVNWATWMLVIYVTLIYQYYVCFTSGSTLSIVLMLTLALSVFFSIRMLVNSTKVSKSSSYGTTAKSK